MLPPLERHPGRIFIERYGPVRYESDVIRYADFLREEARIGDDPPVDLSRIHSHFSIPVPILTSLPGQQGILVDGDAGLIMLDEDDPVARQRFSHSHELMEILFAAHDGLVPHEHWRRRFGEQEKERLCELGAAHLLMPISSLLPRLPDRGIGLDLGSELAGLHETSFLATLYHMTRLGPGAHILALWRRCLKPVQERMVPSELQPSLFGDEYDLTPPKKLRVWWSTSTYDQKDFFLPRHKSVLDGSLIADAYKTGTGLIGSEIVDFGKVMARCVVEAKRVTIGGELCIVSLIHLPDDRGCAVLDKVLGLQKV